MNHLFSIIDINLILDSECGNDFPQVRYDMSSDVHLFVCDLQHLLGRRSQLVEKLLAAPGTLPPGIQHTPYLLGEPEVDVGLLHFD